MRRGPIGVYARWAADYYHAFMRHYPGSSVVHVLGAMIDMRYNSPGTQAPEAKKELMEILGKGGIDGIRELVVAFLATEGHLVAKSLDYIEEARRCIGRELEKSGVPWNFISDPELIVAKLSYDAKLAAEEISRDLMTRIKTR
jgi:hypothetical protein